MPEIAYINGEWSPLGEAKISIEDRGFQFGDGVYEVIRTYGRDVFGLKEHLARLERSAREIEITLPYSIENLEAAIQLGCQRCGFGDIQIYIQLTRGRAPRGHAFPEKPAPTLVMTFRETVPIPIKHREAGVEIISTEDVRWGRCHIKSLNLLPNVLARELAKQAGAFEAIFIRHGKVTEGAGSNLFAVMGQKVVTPPEGPYILSGITREVVLSIGGGTGLEMSEGDLNLEALYAADEIFLTGTTIEVLPVVRLNGRTIGQGTPGKVSQSLYQAFQSYVRKQK